MRERLIELDTGLLLAMEALLQEQNVSRAAQRLGLSQPALSGRLARLRRLFGDQLFLPAAGRGMVPTPRALEIERELDDVLARLRALVAPEPEFDPAASQRTFVIAAYETPAAILAPDLLACARAQAPGVRLAFVLPRPGMVEALESGDIDLIIGGRTEGLDDLVSRTLFDDTFLTAQRRGHPRGTGPLTLDAFCAADHLLISTEGGGFNGVVDEQLAALGRNRRVVASTQNYALAPLLIAGSDCLCTLPGRLLERFSASLDVFPPPLELEPVRTTALWHPRMRDDPAHRWLRERLFAVAARQRN